MKQNIFTINVVGDGGYSFMVETDIEDEGQVISAAVDNNLFSNDDDADRAIADNCVTEYDINHFKKVNCYYVI
jgi:hypothetical protein